MIYLKKDNQIAEIASEVIAKNLLDSGFTYMNEEEIVSYKQKEEERENYLKNRKPSYAELVSQEVHKKYSIDDEIAILRQRDTKPEEFAEYNEYVESCKAKVKSEMGG